GVDTIKIGVPGHDRGVGERRLAGWQVRTDDGRVRGVGEVVTGPLDVVVVATTYGEHRVPGKINVLRRDIREQDLGAGAVREGVGDTGIVRRIPPLVRGPDVVPVMC